MSLLTTITDLITPFKKQSASANTAPIRSKNEAQQAQRSPPLLHKVQSGKIVKSKRVQDQHANNWNVPILNKFLDSLDQAEGHPGESCLEGDTLVHQERLDDPASNTLVNIEDEGGLEHDDRFLDPDDVRFQDFSAEEIWLFNKLSRRGMEPLLPAAWQLDFDSFPDDLFSEDENEAFISNVNTTVTEATQELATLVDAGPRCRDALNRDQVPERPLKRGIERYNKWALRDAKIQPKSYIDLIAVVAAKPSENVPATLDLLTRKLHSLAQQWRDALRHPDCNKDDEEQFYTRDPPTLYGFLIKYSVVAIVTHDASKPDKPVRNIVASNHQMDGYDVWAALAISVVCVRARNQLLSIDGEGKLDVDMTEDDDPDA